MAVDDPFDVLGELLQLYRSYVGPRLWEPTNGTYSNPVKILKTPLDEATPHTSPRKDLSGRSGSALFYALMRQGAGFEPNAAFSRVFSHPDGRRLMLEKGVTRDLLAIGAITPSPSGRPHEYALTGLGSQQLRKNFSELPI